MNIVTQKTKANVISSQSTSCPSASDKLQPHSQCHTQPRIYPILPYPYWGKKVAAAKLGGLTELVPQPAS